MFFWGKTYIRINKHWKGNKQADVLVHVQVIPVGLMKWVWCGRNRHVLHLTLACVLSLSHMSFEQAAIKITGLYYSTNSYVSHISTSHFHSRIRVDSFCSEFLFHVQFRTFRSSVPDVDLENEPNHQCNMAYKTDKRSNNNIFQ